MAQTTNILTRPIKGKLCLTGVLALAGIAGPVILLITDWVTALADPQYNFIRDSISSLAWTQRGWIQTIGFLVIGLLVELFVAGLFFSVRGVRGFGFGLTILVLFGFGLLLIGAFHTDQVGGPHTFEGAIHGVAAKTIFWFFPAASLLIAPSLKKDSFWRPLFLYTVGAAIFALVLMICGVGLSDTMITGKLLADTKGWFGLFERILVADEIIWIAIVAIWLFRLSWRTCRYLPE